MTEQWRPVPGYEGSYEASDHGQIRSLDRLVHRPNKRPYRTPGRMKRLKRVRADGYLRVSLSKGGDDRWFLVHRIVALTFLGPPPFPTAFVCHSDGDRLNNRVDNLRWGSASDNNFDTVLHGNHACANKTHCPQGHPYDDANTTYVREDGKNPRRACRECHRQWSQRCNERRKLLRREQWPLLTCRVCGSDFRHPQRKAVFCSDECKKASRRVSFIRSVVSA